MIILILGIVRGYLIITRKCQSCGIALPFPSIEGSMGDRKCLQKATPRWKFVAAFGPTPGEESDGHVGQRCKVTGPLQIPRWEKWRYHYGIDDDRWDVCWIYPEDIMMMGLSCNLGKFHGNIPRRVPRGPREW